MPFLRLSGKIEAQVWSSRGAIRYALRTDLPHKRFWTISVWNIEGEMELFSRSEPHRTAIKNFLSWGTDSAAIAGWESSEVKID